MAQLVLFVVSNVVVFRCDRPHTNHRSDHGNLPFAAYWPDATIFLPQMASLPYGFSSIKPVSHNPISCGCCEVVEVTLSA